MVNGWAAVWLAWVRVRARIVMRVQARTVPGRVGGLSSGDGPAAGPGAVQGHRAGGGQAAATAMRMICQPGIPPATAAWTGEVAAPGPYPQGLGKQPGQRGEDRPVRPVQLGLRVLPPQHCHLLAQHQESGVFRRRRTRHQRHPSGQANEDQVKHPQGHKPAMLPAAGLLSQANPAGQLPMPRFGTPQARRPGHHARLSRAGLPADLPDREGRLARRRPVAGRRTQAEHAHPGQPGQAGYKPSPASPPAPAKVKPDAPDNAR